LREFEPSEEDRNDTKNKDEAIENPTFNNIKANSSFIKYSRERFQK